MPDGSFAAEITIFHFFYKSGVAYRSWTNNELYSFIVCQYSGSLKIIMHCAHTQCNDPHCSHMGPHLAEFQKRKKLAPANFLTQKISTKKWPKSDLRLPKIAQK